MPSRPASYGAEARCEQSSFPPDDQTVQRIEQMLPQALDDALRRRNHLIGWHGADPYRPEDYYRQYVGEMRDEVIVYGFHKSVLLRRGDWRTCAIDVKDGGENYFVAYYDSKTGKLTLVLNGYA